MPGYANRLRTTALTAMERDRRLGQQAEDEFLRRSLEFDPGAAARETAQGLFDEFEQGVGRGIRNIRSSLAGTGGRLMSGYGQEQEDEYVADARRDLNSRLAQLAMQAAGLNLENIRGLGSFGQATTDRFLDLVSGERDRELLAQQMRRQSRSSLFGSLASLAGTVLGGPIGGVAAKWAAGKLGLAGATE